jgi:hypothetical protein
MAVRCPGCGSQLAANARFCSLCGKEAVPATLPTTPPVQMAPQTVRPNLNPTGNYAPQIPTNDSSKKRIALFSALGGIGVAVALFFALRAAGVLGVGATQTPSAAVLTAPNAKAIPAPVLNAPEAAQPPAPVLNPPQKQEVPMPEDVVAYLRWLKKFDAARRSLESRMTVASAKMIPMITVAQAEVVNSWSPENDGASHSPQKPATNAMRQELSVIAQQMNEAPAKFQSYPPPNACANLALAYQDSLAIKVRQVVQMQDTFQQILSAFEGNGNTSGLNDIYAKLASEFGSNSMSKEADGADVKANEELNSLRSRYTSMPDDVRTFGISSVDDQSLKKLIPSIPGLTP